ncbi:TonB-dependent receptor [Parabacteroides timonensis]|uniref:TonB-dependent receptor n=1 Tax=Parabacteroides timonensis TaxID=1871013 RepID=UPI001F45DBB7|nr:TonB-dependent receptor [Parabacteroides timonensis]
MHNNIIKQWRLLPFSLKKIIRIAEMGFLFSLLFSFNLLAAIDLQSNKVSIKKSNCTIIEILKELEQSSSFLFCYNDKEVDVNQRTSINVNNASLEDVLDLILKKNNYSYRIINNQILIEVDRKTAGKIAQQKKEVSGLVLDSEGEPIAGANIVVKGTNNGTITDIDGKFALEVPENAVLQVSFIGFLAQEVTVKGTNVTISLREDTQKLEEVVVVGYGTQKKVTLTGAVAAISGDEILTTKNENVENMLSGKIPGVRVVQKSGEPGSYNNSFEIRGMGNPLIIVDGVPRENMNRLDPNEIENISILKDASAAIYGVRAANGVVLITTKKGAGTKLQLDYNGSVGWQRASGLPETGNAIEYMTLMNENAINNGRDPMYSQDDIDAYRTGKKQSTDWTSSAINETAPQTQHSFSATGSTEKVNYFLNFGYLNQEGFWKSGDLNYERFNIRSNISAQISKRLKAEMLIGAMKDTKNSPYHDAWIVYKSIWTQVPTWPLYANDNPNYLYNAADADHPIAITDSDISGYKKNNSKSFQGTFNLEYDVPYIDGLKAKASYSYDYLMWESKEFAKEYTLYTYDAETNVYSGSKAQSPSDIRRSFRENESSLLQLQLNYVRTFNEKHNINVLALYEESTSRMDNFYAKRQLSMDAVDQLFAGNSLNQEGSMDGSGYRPNTKLADQNGIWKIVNKGFVGRFNYDYSSKYIAEFSFRYDGSSKFASGHQWGFFPAGSIGWRVSEESFMKDSPALSFINNLKLRASYGKMGDDNSSTYQFLSGYDYPSGGYVMGNSYVNGLGMRGMANPYITWYTSKMLNVGLDADLWSGLLGFQFDIFSRDRDGLLATRNLSLPGTVGAGLPQENLEGDLTKGFELALTHRNQIRDFNYYFSGNISFTRTHWTYKEISQRGNSYRNWRDNYTDRYNDLWWGLGYVGQFNSYDQAHNSPIQDSKGNSILRPGDYAYEDWNGDGVIDDNDIHPIATTGYPKINFGFTLGAEWKGFDLNLVFQGAAKSNVKYPEQLEGPLMWDRNGLSMFMDRWHLADPNDPDSEWIPGYYPSTNRGETTNYKDSERSVQSANYLRLKSLELGYSLPSSVLKYTGIQRARIYFSGYNIFTITGMKYLDPEHPSDTYGYLYPLTKSYNIGLNITF